MCLTHSTGFLNFWFLEPDRKLKIHFDPGTRFSYSGEGMMLLQFAIEKGLGLDLGELTDRAFQQLGMPRTSLIWRADGLADVLSAMDRGFGGIAVRPVHPDAGKPAIRILVRAIKGSRAPLQLCAGLMLNDESGEPNPEAQAVLAGEGGLAFGGL